MEAALRLVEDSRSRAQCRLDFAQPLARASGPGDARRKAVSRSMRPWPQRSHPLVEPVSNGIGSAVFAIVWDRRQLHGLNASGRSPAAWTLRPKPAGCIRRPALPLAAGHASERRGGLAPATLDELHRRATRSSRSMTTTNSAAGRRSGASMTVTSRPAIRAATARPPAL
jgi:hypothetical protein